MHPWLARLRHDLLKHALWCARDLGECADAGGPLKPADLQAPRRSLLALPRGERRPVTPARLRGGLGEA